MSQALPEPLLALSITIPSKHYSQDIFYSGMHYNHRIYKLYISITKITLLSVVFFIHVWHCQQWNAGVNGFTPFVGVIQTGLYFTGEKNVILIETLHLVGTLHSITGLMI